MTSNAEKAARAAASAPESWARIRLGDICEIVRGVSYKKDQASDQPEKGKVPILRATNIQDNALVLDSDLVYVPSDVVSDEQMLRVGDIVVATSSGSKHLVGKTAQVKESWRGSFGAFCAALRPKTEIDHRYLGYFFGSQEYKDYIRKKALGVNINNLRRGDLEEISVPVAPLDQQKRIVAEIEKQFSRLDEAVANLKRVKANLKRYKAAVLKAAVEGRLVETEAELAAQGRANVAGGTTPGATARQYESGAQLLQRILETRRSQWKGKGKYKEPAAPDTTDLPELPEGWVWASLDQLSWDSSYGTSAKCAYENKGPPVLRIPNVDKAAIDLANVKYAPTDLTVAKEESLSPGDMLVIRTNGSKSLIGRAAVVTTQFQRPTTYASYLIRFRLLGDPVLSAWVLSYWQSHSSRSWIESKAATSAGQHNISMTVLATAPIPLPPADEQDRIVAEVERRLSLLRETETQVNINVQRADRLRQAILTKAFSGLLVTHVARREMGAAS